MRDTVVRTLIELAKENKNIELLTGDLGFGVLKPYWEALPDQFTNAGIAEQNMTTVAAGMALTGKTVFTYSIGNFPTLRCLEQIRNDCTYHNANVKIICVGGGLVYGSLGMSHHATEDMAVMRALPGMVVMAPGDPVEAAEAVKAIAEHQGTCYLRLGRGGERRIHEKLPDFKIGKAVRIETRGKQTGKSVQKEAECGTEAVRMSGTAGRTIAVFSAGAILDAVCDACAVLEESGISVIQYSFPTVKPIDRETVMECAEKAEAVFTVEEHNITGGFGSAVAEVMAEGGCGIPLYRLGLNDEYCTKVGSQQYLRNEYGISAEKIESYIRQKLEHMTDKN